MCNSAAAGEAHCTPLLFKVQPDGKRILHLAARSHPPLPKGRHQPWGQSCPPSGTRGRASVEASWFCGAADMTRFLWSPEGVRTRFEKKSICLGRSEAVADDNQEWKATLWQTSVLSHWSPHHGLVFGRSLIGGIPKHCKTIQSTQKR